MQGVFFCLVSWDHGVWRHRPLRLGISFLRN